MEYPHRIYRYLGRTHKINKTKIRTETIWNRMDTKLKMEFSSPYSIEIKNIGRTSGKHIILGKVALLTQETTPKRNSFNE